MTTDRDRLTQQECQAWYGDNVENMQHHILKHCRNVLALGATRQTSFDGNNGRTISRPIKIDRDFETNCPTHFLHTHTRQGNMRVCVMHRASWVSSGPEHTETAAVLTRTLLETQCQIILPHTHTHKFSLSHTRNTQNSTSTPQKYKLKLMPSNTLWRHGKVIFLSDSFRDFHLNGKNKYTLCECISNCLR